MRIPASVAAALQRKGLLFALSALLGFLIWLLSAPLAGRQEPWDANNGYYIGALVVVGVVTGFLGPRHFWLWPIGAYLGQCVYILGNMIRQNAIGADLFIPLGMLTLVLALVPNLIGAAVGAGLRAIVGSRVR
ncbi:MAG: hypothetical protein ACRD96_20540 [Bryobacteraceae bacterium]